MVFAKQYTGQRFGRLVVTGRTKPGYGSGQKSMWLCQCDCGGKILVPTDRLSLGQTKSCGCLLKDSARQLGKSNVTHGMTNASEFRIWAGMINRCENINDPSYYRYGGRGIKVCERWRNSFEDFYADMGPRPTEGHSIDRKDNDGNYEPDNCRWATRREQMNNRSVNVRYEFQGKSLTLAEIARILGVSVATLRSRISRGMRPEVAFRLPINR